MGAIIQRPVMRLRTSSAARRADSVSNRTARSSVRPIVFPRRIPETESDSWTIEETSASEAWRSGVPLLRWALPLAGARAREERQRQPLEMAVHLRAQVVHHALADLVREQRLPHADDAGDDGDRDHSCDQSGQQAHVLLGDRDVEDLA